MIGIRQADGTISWILDELKPDGTTVELQPMRHGQTRVVVPLLRRTADGSVKSLGRLVFKPRQAGFLDLPMLEANFRLDAQNRLAVTIEGAGRTAHARFALGKPLKPAKNLSSKTNDTNIKESRVKKIPSKTIESTSKPQSVPVWMAPATLVLFSVGTLGLVGALLIAIVRLAG